MYYCHNCRGEFERAVASFHPYPDFGGEPIELCPLCGAPEQFSKITTEPVV
ncbi:MAG: hypothetical protein IJN42_00170 [Clostridia bacterium]|nr:hypothetical protein [Clostridia bacterium]